VRKLTPLPPTTALAQQRLGADRIQLFKTRGLCTVRLPAPPVRKHGSFSWLVDPLASNSIEEATWYCDGSLVLGKWAPLRTTGFGIAVVASDGELIGFGYGTPPSRIYTAAAAELWAIAAIIDMCPFPPKMKTDCLSLISAAKAGTVSATDGSRQLARMWKAIAANLGADISALVLHGRLTWIPAHLPYSAVGERTLPCGARLTAIDWRANRLVDMLAKLGATGIRRYRETPGQHRKACYALRGPARARHVYR